MSDDRPDTRDALNPYGLSPSTTLGPPRDNLIILPEGTGRGGVGHVTVVGILMVVQGILGTLAGVAIGGYAIWMPSILSEMRQQTPPGGNPAPAMTGEMETWFVVGMGMIALMIGVLGILTIWMGIHVIRFRSRRMAIAVLVAGMLNLTTCYCFPTAFILAVYGCVVLLNSSVALAFELRRQNHSAASIQEAFAALRPATN